MNALFNSATYSDHYVAQREWVAKLNTTVALLSRSAMQAQRNFDQYLTAMEHVSALYKDYGALLSSAKDRFLKIDVDIPGVADVKTVTSRLHSCVHKWEHCSKLHAVRDQLHLQTKVLMARSGITSKALDLCTEREKAITRHSEKYNRLQRKKNKKDFDVEGLRKEVQKLDDKWHAIDVQTQREVEAVARKSTDSVLELATFYFKAMHKNGVYVAKHFNPSRIGEAEDNASSTDAADENGTPVTGVFGHHYSPRSEVSSVAASGVYGVNRNTYQAGEALQPATIAPQPAASNTGIPLRYTDNTPPPAPSA